MFVQSVSQCVRSHSLSSFLIVAGPTCLAGALHLTWTEERLHPFGMEWNSGPSDAAPKFDEFVGLRMVVAAAIGSGFVCVCASRGMPNDGPGVSRLE